MYRKDHILSFKRINISWYVFYSGQTREFSILINSKYETKKTAKFRFQPYEEASENNFLIQKTKE